MTFTPEIAFVIGTIAVGLAIAWGIFQYKTRNKQNDAITEQATRDQYRKSTDDYEAEREELKRELK